MTVQPDKPTRRRWLPPWPAMLLILAVLYPLSFTPMLIIINWLAHWSVVTGPQGGNVLLAIYAPIFWAMRQSEAVEAVMSMYVDVLQPLLPP